MDTSKTLFGRPANPQSFEAAVRENAEVDAEAADEIGCWGWLRGVRDRAQMLELRRKDGTIHAVAYGWIEGCTFDPGEGTLTLHAGKRDIVITGRNLHAEARPNLRLFTAIARHRALWVKETDTAEQLRATSDATVIESITW